MKYVVVICAVVLFSCKTDNAGEVTKTDSPVTARPIEFPETRTSVKSSPAAEFSEPIKDELNDWKFYVALYETKRTFHFMLRIQCKEVRVSDSINIPNFGIEPKVEIHKGKEPLTAIIGFLDKKNVFQEYREVSFRNDRLRVRTLHTYSVGVYRKATEQ